MFKRVHRSAARLLLAVMLITFLAPGFAWQAHASHEELAHGGEATAVSAHDHDHDSGASDHDDEAHTAIGHLLGHLPASLSSGIAFTPIPPATSQFAEVLAQCALVAPEPPLRPPRLS